ncbi:hypothetical protein FBU59_003658 [Linderina macrospora]|uniref:Uncharacterized protein n=1 Tax=Linderina macrospora TaxID=4868 RepID=A0ACC1J7L7_9FUNG|nr:hypothetical protein FBU59_003658 [Linderina macrospora]
MPEQSTKPTDPKTTVPTTGISDDDDDEWDKRIKRTGCFDENERLLICHADTGDWRQCTAQMLAFKQCMRRNAQTHD